MLAAVHATETTMTLRTKTALALLTLLGLALAGCRPGGEITGDDEVTTPDEALTLTMTHSDVPEATIRSAISDLAAHLDIEPAQVEVLDAKTVTWSNGALGCPKPGGMYTQALVDGYLIRLNAGEQVHHYHGRNGGDPFRCPPERRGKPVDTSRAK